MDAQQRAKKHPLIVFFLLAYLSLGYLVAFGLGALAIILVEGKKAWQTPAVGAHSDSGVAMRVAP